MHGGKSRRVGLRFEAGLRPGKPKFLATLDLLTALRGPHDDTGVVDRVRDSAQRI